MFSICFSVLTALLMNTMPSIHKNFVYLDPTSVESDADQFLFLLSRNYELADAAGAQILFLCFSRRNLGNRVVFVFFIYFLKPIKAALENCLTWHRFNGVLNENQPAKQSKCFSKSSAFRGGKCVNPAVMTFE